MSRKARGFYLYDYKSIGRSSIFWCRSTSPSRAIDALYHSAAWGLLRGLASYNENSGLLELELHAQITAYGEHLVTKSWNHQRFPTQTGVTVSGINQLPHSSTGSQSSAYPRNKMIGDKTRDWNLYSNGAPFELLYRITRQQGTLLSTPLLASNLTRHELYIDDAIDLGFCNVNKSAPFPFNTCII